MGMYTELYLGISFKEETPQEVINLLQAMVSGKDDMEKDEDQLNTLLQAMVNMEKDKDQLKKLALPHPFFQTSRWYWCLRSGGSYYFDAKPHCYFGYDDITHRWYLTCVTNIKNYEGEWQKFLDWIAPHIDTQGHLGHLRYEEDEYPTLIFKSEDQLKLINSAPIFDQRKE